MMLAASITAHAQRRIDFDQWSPQPLPDSAAPLMPCYGANGNEFWIGGYIDVKPDPAHPQVASLWDFVKDLGIRVFESRRGTMWSREDDTLAETADGFNPLTGRWGTALFVNQYPLDDVGHAHSIQYFPFDSAESFYWPCKFLQRSGGDRVYNPTPTLHDYKKHPIQERLYSTANTAPNDTILKQMVMGYDAGRTVYRYKFNPGWDIGDSIQDCGNIFYSDVVNGGVRGNSLYFGVMAHLFNPADPNVHFVGPTAGNNDTLLAIEIWNEIPKGASWGECSGAIHTDPNIDREFLYTTLPIRKRDLLPADTSNPDWNAYREVMIPVDMVVNAATCLSGAFANSQNRFDVRVRWTGKEMLALRSIVIRDEIGNKVFGTDSAAIRYRDTLMHVAEAEMRGPDYGHNSDTTYLFDSTRPSRQDKIIRFYTGDEPLYSRYAGYSFVDSMLYRLYPSPFLTGRDTLAHGVRGWHSMTALNPSNFIMTSQTEIPVETYLTSNPRTSGEVDTSFPVNYMGLPAHITQIPSLREHNGGRFTIPELVVAPGVGSPRDSVEMYARALNRMGYGSYVPNGRVDWPYASPIHSLGTAAWVSRRTGRRVIQYTGVQHLMYITWNRNQATNTYRRDTVFSHQQEAAEIRLTVNLGLCYGARGIHYSYLGGHDNQYVGGPVRKTSQSTPIPDSLDVYFGRNYKSDFGPVGFRTLDTVRDIEPEIHLTSGWQDHPRQFDTLFNMWTGWRTLPRQLKWINRIWIPRIDSALINLRWRDGYSIAFTVPQTYYNNYQAGIYTASRPIASNEIVRGIEAYDRWGRKDSAISTYVELGLFDAHKGATAIDDTNYIMVVNRRTFERPDDVPANSARGRLMDSLTEIRRVRVQFRLRHPDSTAWNLVRVRELQPDTEPLLAGGPPRAGLDTVIRGDSAVNLVLRTGGAALLAITYCRANDSLAVGDIRFNNQRKLVWDGRYWHAVYFRGASFRLPPGKQTPMTDDQVYYRRSLPSDSSRGAIRWDPRAECNLMVSDTNDEMHCIENRFPSLTVRDDSSSPGKRVVTVVWSSYGGEQGGIGHHILIRNIHVPDGVDEFPSMSPIEVVGFARGRLDTAWGTPVVSRLMGGYMIAWADSIAGIVTRFRALDTAGQWWNKGGVYSALDSVSRSYATSCGTCASQYPSMPPFAHVAGRDSSVGLVWQQGLPSSPQGVPLSQIRYVRLVDSLDSATQVHWIGAINHAAISQTDTWRHIHPSIDMTQDVWCGAQEGVTWESMKHTAGPKPQYSSRLHFTSLWSETSRGWDPVRIWYDTNGARHVGDHWRPYHDSLERMWQWTYNTFQLPGASDSVFGFHYPSTASLNARIDTTRRNDSVYFALALSETPLYAMRQFPVQYATSYLWPNPVEYFYGGFNPSASASPKRQQERQSVLYSAERTASRLETTRQFFAKSRPHGYMAQGRVLHLPICDSTATSMIGALHDVWYSGADGAGPLRLVARPDSLRRTDSLGVARGLFRTADFHAHDSTVIGCRLWGGFTGDAAAANGMRVELVAEVVDSATGIVVGRLDSFTVAPGIDPHDTAVEPAIDLVTGTYYVRLRIEPVGVVVEPNPHRPLLPVEEFAMYVDEEHAAKARRLDAPASQGRITAQPNPVAGATEIRFSVPAPSRTSVTVYDGAGREVRRLVDGEMMETGRYTIDLDATMLPPGSYMVELRCGIGRSVQRIVIMR